MGSFANLDVETLKSYFKAVELISKPDNIILLVRAAEGFKGSNQMPIDLELTKKRYYTPLQEMVDFGLVAKAGMNYSLTPKGKLVLGVATDMLELMGSDKNIELTGGLLGIKQFNNDAKEVLGFLRKVHG